MQDLISKQAVLDALNVKCMMPVWCKVLVEKMLKDLPSAQPERKRGRWIPGREIAREYYGPTFTIDYENHKCSSCGLTLKDLLYNVNDEPFYKYCPNCGAEMKNDD